MRIKIYHLGNKFHIEMNRTDTVADLKKKIAEEQGISPQIFHLVYKFRRLKDHKTLQSYKIKETSTIYQIANNHGY